MATGSLSNRRPASFNAVRAHPRHRNLSRSRCSLGSNVRNTCQRPIRIDDSPMAVPFNELDVFPIRGIFSRPFRDVGVLASSEL
ncbi:hypothetical protein KM043_005713 [Ampulex compressa]|nr:hypothetical protein KM043_005713 [Ampulex compressa]